MKIHKLAVLVASLGIFASASFTQVKPDSPSTQPAGKTEFEKLDANGDGKISKDELKAAIAAWFKAIDANNDGKASPEEYVAEMVKFLKTCKCDKDGAVTLEAYVAGSVPAGTKAADGSKIPAEIKGTTLFAVIDLDGDGNITAAEFAGWAVARFKVQDASSDGKLTPEERKAAAEKWLKLTDTDSDGNITSEEFIIRWVGK